MTKKTIIIYITLFFFFLSTILLHPRDLLKSSQKTDPFTINEKILPLINAGNGRFFSSFYWMLTLLQSDHDHYKGDNKSWLFYRFFLISTLDPLFYENYKNGGLYLSVIKDDTLGAKEIYEKGLEFYPNDFWLNFQGGFNDYFELSLPKDALKKLIKIVDHPLSLTKIKYIPSIVAKLKAHEGDYLDAYTFLKKHLNSMKNPFFKKHFEDIIYSIKAKIDIDCLNNRKTNCNTRDEKGVPYPKNKHGKYFSKKPLKKLKSKRPSK